MSRRSRALHRAAAAAAPAIAALPGEPNVRPVSTSSFQSIGWGGGAGWQAADSSRGRGYLYWPDIDTRTELPDYSRSEQLRRMRWMDANVGLAGRIHMALARMVVGTGLMPRATTADREWNKQRDALFEQRNGSASVFDLGGWWDFYGAQYGTQYCANRDGDCGGILTGSEAGLARMAFVEGHRIANGRMSDGEADYLFDGVRVDRNNAPVSYRVLGDDDTQADIPASNFFYLGRRTSPGRRRSPPILHRVGPHMIDIAEINGFLKRGIKNASRIGYMITKATGAAARPPGIPPGIPVERSKVETASGKKINMDKVLDGGGEVADLDPGEELKLLLDQRPHPNAMEFTNTLIREAVLSTDFSPELIWNIASLGGANVRYVMADAQSAIELGQQNLIDSWLARYWFYDTRKEIAAGRLRECRDPSWWLHAWIPPARLTVDKGRDGKLYLEQVRSGALTFRRMYGWDGLNSDIELGEWMDEMAWIAEGAKQRGLDPEKTLDRIYGRPGAPTPVAATEEEPGKNKGGDDEEAAAEEE